MSLRYVGGPRDKRERKRHQHQSWKGGLKGRGPQEVGLRQQIMNKEVMAIEEIELSRRTEVDLHTLESSDNEGEMSYIWRIELRY